MFQPVYVTLELGINEAQQFIQEKKLNISFDENSIHDKGGKSISINRAEVYFRTLKKSEVLKLAEIYKYDLEMFSYDYHHYYDLAQDEKD